jgi:ferredoxin
MGKAKVSFVPLNRSREVKTGATILAAANQSGIPIGQSCSGEGICGWCRVTVLSGADELVPPSDLERQLMAEKEFSGNERAACLARVKGDITITTSYW